MPSIVVAMPVMELCRCAAGIAMYHRNVNTSETATIASAWATHRHPKFWDDPLSFDPERFTPEREKARHRYAYFPFGGGPRACIGQYFSMLESVIVTAMLMRDYEVETTERKVPLFVGITLRPAGPMPAVLKPR